MSDLISRQAAIDEWKNDFKGYVNALDIPRDDYNGIMAYIDEVPSAQPDGEYISQQAVTESDLIDWYINSVDESEPVWTEEHIYELFNDFYLIPKED